MKCYMVKTKTGREEPVNRTELNEFIKYLDKYEEFTIRRVG